MFALLFDRRSLIVTGVALAGVAGLLFAAGVVTGLTLRRERVVVPPAWLTYGPVETSDVRSTDRRRGTGPTAPSAAATGGDGTAGGTGAGTTTPPDTQPEHVPFSKPGDPVLEEASPPDSGVRARPPEGATQGGAAQDGSQEGGAEQDGAKKDGAKKDGVKRDGGGLTPAAPAAGGGAEAPGLTTHRAAADCPEPGQPTWYVQTGAYAVAGNARMRHESLQARFATAGGPRPYLHRTVNSSGVELTLVRLGPFTTRQAASRAAAALEDAFVGIDAEGVTGLCGTGEESEAVAGLGTAGVALANRTYPAG